ncbi:hypothetical protein F8O01_02700 [Pseudoclavibacter chungangensis]|uniref:Galactokinase n=1 Tax=Pseudoclavibacter chungangensis TaxID=587635 RepID=A0A7J5C025_9MICO|nr:galactokinase family protein [Pseudoclavibacter chungangensis]KAB1660259.1 hypothetical protein F8O01_02700 [Pseudoclavibacter chungangensis]NYJ65602.1 galactokinase [Pseudoclavibacter chungangensis]
MPRDLTSAVHEGFRTSFGVELEGVWSAPGRVSMAGDHTDEHDGLSLAFAIGIRSAVAVRRRDDDRVVIATDLTDERADTDLATIASHDATADWRSYPIGTIRAALEHGRDDEADDSDADDSPARVAATGLDIFLSTDLPVGGGLSSSASVCAAVGIALDELWALGLSRGEIAALGRTAEQTAAGAATGLADHATVLFAEPERAVFYDARGDDADLIEMPELDAHQLVPLVVVTGEHHRNWSGAIAERLADGVTVAEELGCQSLREVRSEELEAAKDRLEPRQYRRARYIVGEIARTLELTRVLRTEGPREIGPILRDSQASLRDDFEVSTERIDRTVEWAQGAGALGARITGAGLGGSVFVLAPESDVGAIVAALERGYREHGWKDPHVVRVAPSAGARRDR